MYPDDPMNDYLEEATEELKRLEHIIYVSLKYTRTVDVIINALRRMVSTFDFIIEAYLLKAKEENLIDGLVKSPALRATHLKELYSTDQEFQHYFKFYFFLKNVLNSKYSKREEFRRHVTMIVELKNATSEIKIDNLVNSEKFLHNFLRLAFKQIEGITSEED
tara:strand:- start:190 stop:678 length:489 start_codon:yes stop_codon:yes gene_type:complete